MAAIQLDFFQEKPTEIDMLRLEVKELKESQNKVRKALFARHGELNKMYIELHDRLHLLEYHICKGKK